MGNKIQNKVIIWGVDNFNTLGILRQLVPFGIDVFFLVYGKVTNCATKSKYCKEFVQCNSIEDGYSYLFDHFKNEEYKPIIITPGDEIIEFIDQHREEMLPFFIIPGTTQQGLLTKIDNKIEMAGLAKKHGIDVPQSRTCKWDTPIDDVVFPCFLKPSHITKNKKNEFKYKKCNSKSELQHILKYVRKDSVFLLQEFIPSEKEFVVSGCRTFDGKTIIGGTFRCDRYADDGNSSYGFLTSEIPESIDVTKIERFLEDIDYYGVFGFEYGHNQGKSYFFEVNLRNNGTSQSFYLSGANLVLAWVLSAAGVDYSNVSTRIDGNHYFMDELMDYSNVLHRRVSKKEWKKQREQADILKYYNKDDMEPYHQMKKVRGKTMLQFAVVKKIRPYIVYVMDHIRR